jgi:hypothetical protein
LRLPRSTKDARSIAAICETNEMMHLTDEQLALHFYGENDDRTVSEHLDECDTCRAEMERISLVLNSVEMPIPERGDEYGAQVWHNLRGLLPENKGRAPWYRSPLTLRWAALGAVAALIVTAFFLGRVTQQPKDRAVVQTPVQIQPVKPAPKAREEVLEPRTQNASVEKKSGNPALRQGRDRILLVAVGDHLERSQMILVELMNATPGESLDISQQQKIAEDLVSENRLYRQAAKRDKDASVASLLDELERVLVEIAHEPSKLSGPELESVKRRIEAQGIVFKVRVVGSQIQQRNQRPRAALGKST